MSTLKLYVAARSDFSKGAAVWAAKFVWGEHTLDRDGVYQGVGVSSSRACLDAITIMLHTLKRKTGVEVYTDNRWVVEAPKGKMGWWAMSDWKDMRGSPLTNAVELKSLHAAIAVKTHGVSGNLIGREHPDYAPVVRVAKAKLR